MLFVSYLFSHKILEPMTYSEQYIFLNKITVWKILLSMPWDLNSEVFRIKIQFYNYIEESGVWQSFWH